MKIFQSIISISFVAILALSSCKKEDNTGIDKNKKGKMSLHFDNRAGSQDLTLNTVTYQNALGQDLTISTFNYYISNIKLINKDGSTFTYPTDKSYFLVKESDVSTQEIELTDIQEGDYTGVTYTIGVDSAKSVSPLLERTGVLDPSLGAAGMYWAWNSGYIFMKLEGTSPSAPLDTASGTRFFQYHIGLYGGFSTPTINNVKEVTLSFDGATAAIRQSKTEGPEAHIYVDVLKVLIGTTNVDIATTPYSHGNAYSANIANNYKNMFKLDHLHGN